jgi:hypothetical protein
LDLCADDFGACDRFRVAEAQVLKRAASRRWRRGIEYTSGKSLSVRVDVGNLE